MGTVESCSVQCSLSSHNQRRERLGIAAHAEVTRAGGPLWYIAVEALDATAFESASALRERIRKLAKQRLGEGATLLKLQALVERCRHLTDQRNEFVHSVWAKQLDGEPLRSDPREGWVPIPSKEQLDQLSEKVMRLTHEINYERLEGFLYQALKK